MKKHNPHGYFDIYWEKTQNDKVIASWKAARDKGLEAEDAYNECFYSNARYELEDSLCMYECERLEAMDYLVELTVQGITGYLAKEQVENFSCGEYGYIINWADVEETLDE